MERIEKREVKVKYCDFCGKETEHVSRCGICGKDMCDTAKHAAYSLEIYRYEGDLLPALFGSHICVECAKENSIGLILDTMIDRKY